MALQKVVSFIFAAALIQIAMKYGSAIKILGGFTDVYSSNSAIHHGRIYEWGFHQSDQEGTNVRWIAKYYCRNPFTNKQGFCRLRLVIATENNDRDYHYEIVGTRQVLVDNFSSNVITGTRHEYGKQVAGDGETDIRVASGEAWVLKNGRGNKRYAHLHFIVKRTTRPPLTYAFARKEARKGTDTSNSDYKDYTPAGFSPSLLNNTRNIAEFACWNGQWYQSTNCFLFMWTTHTRMISFSLSDHKEILKSTDKVPKVRPLILENHASGQSTVDFPRLNYSEEVTTTSTAQFVNTFDFAIDYISRPIELDVFGSSSPAPVSCHFVFSDVSDLQSMIENTVSVSMSWPSKCDPGFRVTYNVDSHSEMQRFQVDFEFERGEESWTETKDIEVNLQWIEMNVDDCCLYEYASNTCGTERLPMC